MKVGLRAEYLLQVFSSTPEGSPGVLLREIEPFHNLIVNSGLDYLGGSGNGAVNYCYVGTGTTPPANTDTSMGTFLASTSSYTKSITAATPSVPNTINTFVYTFGTGVATGTLTEVGAGWVSNSSGGLYSRALIVDGGGNPTTLVVQSDEILVITYSIYIVWNTTDTAYSFTFNGSTVSGVYRPSNMSSSSYFPYFGIGYSGNANSQNRYATGSITSITAVPGGASIISGTVDPYVTGTYSASVTSTSSPAGGAITYNSIVLAAWIGSFQFSLSPAISLTLGQTMTLKTSISWNRV